MNKTNLIHCRQENVANRISLIGHDVGNALILKQWRWHNLETARIYCVGWQCFKLDLATDLSCF